MAEPMTTLQRVAAWAPPRSVSVEEMGRHVGLNRHQIRMYRRIHGLDRLRLDPDVDMFELVSAPAKAVLRAAPGTATSIRYLIYAHSISDLTPSGILPADRLRELLGLTGADALAVLHNNCASGLTAIDIAGQLLRADGDPTARALIVTGEAPAARMVRIVVNVCLLGDAAAACLVGLDGEGGRVRSYAAQTLGQFSDGFFLTTEQQNEFDEVYGARVIEVIQQALADAGLRLGDIDMVVPHNVNVSSWLRLCGKLGLSRDRVFLDNIPRYSHTYCTDLFLNLAAMRRRGLLTKGGHYLLVTVGFGATYAAMVLDF